MRYLACLILAAAAVSCERGPAARPEPAAEEGKKDVGVGDFVDYAIGAKQLEIKKRIEKDLEEVRRRREKELEDVLGEHD